MRDCKTWYRLVPFVLDWVPFVRYRLSSAAVTRGQIADIYQARGELDEALKIRTDEELPVYEKLGDMHSLIVLRTQIAMTLIQLDRVEEDGPVIAGHLVWAYANASARGYREADQIGQILSRLGFGQSQLDALIERSGDSGAD